MPTGTILLIIAAGLLIDAMIVSAIASAWRPLAEAFPPRTPAADAVAKRRQTFKLDWLNFGGCIHVAVDADHLHLTPAGWARGRRVSRGSRSASSKPAPSGSTPRC
ncbi:MAG: hypothetical protein ACREJO_06375 [Phycisphaerales bacterium]